MSSSPLISQATTYRHLWVAGTATADWPLGTAVDNRYVIVAPKLWKDTRPMLSSEMPEELPADAIPYMRLHPLRLHVPTLYGFYQADEAAAPMLLLDNIPIDDAGDLYPAIAPSWESASALRQIYWLWQMMQLWTPLQECGVASSLLQPDNIRVQGWRVRLCELFADQQVYSADGAADRADDQTHNAALALPLSPTLAQSPKLTPRQQLAHLWRRWLERTPHSELVQPLQTICDDLQTSDIAWDAIATQLNLVLLDQAAQVPLRVEVIGATTTGPKRSHNEDACYPDTVAIASEKGLGMGLMGEDDELSPHLAIVCDGIGGHASGDVASRLAVRSLKVQMKAMLAERVESPLLVEPSLVMQQIAASIRVVNNVIANQNDSQGRQARERMGTTLVMALQLPQRLPDSAGLVNAHELYLAHVGDSRAYWLTPTDCHLLTVDDDVATRDVMMGRNLHREAQKRPDAGALTQALGTRDGELIRPTVQRLILDEAGILLLCSDGLSDHRWVEKSWRALTRQVMNEQRSLSETVQAWIEIANRRNGHDNTSVVLMHCQLMSSGTPPSEVAPMAHAGAIADETEQELEPLPLSAFDLLADDVDADDHALGNFEGEDEAEDGLTEFAQVFGDSDDHDELTPVNVWAIALGLAVLMGIAGAASVLAWKQLAPNSFERTWDWVTEQIDALCLIN